jgi:hypothetical protein
MVLFEEEGGNPLGITVNTISITQQGVIVDEHPIPTYFSYQMDFNATNGF